MVFKCGDGLVLVEVVFKKGEEFFVGVEWECFYFENFVCFVYGVVMEELFLWLFLFNSFYGVCEVCYGIGYLCKFIVDWVILDLIQLVYFVVVFWVEKDNSYYFFLLYLVGEVFGFEIKILWNEFMDEQWDVLFNGSCELILIQVDSCYCKGKGGYI